MRMLIIMRVPFLIGILVIFPLGVSIGYSSWRTVSSELLARDQLLPLVDTKQILTYVRVIPVAGPYMRNDSLITASKYGSSRRSFWSELSGCFLKWTLSSSRSLVCTSWFCASTSRMRVMAVLGHPRREIIVSDMRGDLPRRLVSGKCKNANKG